MRNRPVLVVVMVLVMMVLCAGVFSAGVLAGRAFAAPVSAAAAPVEMPSLPGLYSTPNEGQNAATPIDLQTLFKPFWEAWDLLQRNYVQQPIDPVVLMRGAIDGMMRAVGDEHTSYMDPKVYEMTTQQLQGEEYEGIGAWVDITGDFLRIINPMPGSPSEKAGLRPGDLVIAIDGEDMTGKDGEYARQHVLGPRGTTVVLTILRKGKDKPFDVTLERAAIVTPSVTGRMVDDTGIAYIRLYTFGDDTAADLKEELRKLMAQNPKGLVLDLRGNGGGYLKTAIEVGSQFISDGKLMIEEYGNGTVQEYDALRGGLALDIPVVVLINGGSASASEIVAGAIQDLQRGYLVGEQSYGKGSVQQWSELSDNQGAVRITIARWLTPSGRQINKLGLRPDFIVELTEDDAANDRDPQLDMAVKVLLEKLLPEPTPIPSPTPTATPVP